ncbi:hypothetical protein [Novosphingobium sp. FKTRR1]|uniref:hypothetical protein n=1 Tax=Novosphingobium sp. FKTRR1 TaxID=2879118 RepID=UPI001CF0AA98|nr:hypothetical protein [Novosphingobium sp. FKTRR1]
MPTFAASPSQRWTALWRAIDVVLHPSAPSKEARDRLVWLGLVWFGLVWLGLVWFGWPLPALRHWQSRAAFFCPITATAAFDRKQQAADVIN